MINDFTIKESHEENKKNKQASICERCLYSSSRSRYFSCWFRCGTRRRWPPPGVETAAAMAAAEKAGWTRDEAAQALLRVATANYLSIDGGRTIDTSAVLGDLIETSRD